jgi:TonB family protein
MYWRNRKELRMGICIGVCSLASGAALTPPARAQESGLNSFATRAASALKTANKRDVVVLDFTGMPGMAALGERLASDFRDELSRDSGGSANLKIEDRAATIDRATEASLTLANLNDPATMRWVYAGSPMDSWISGDLTQSDAGLKLIITIHPLGADNKARDIAQFSGVIPFPPELKSLVTTPQPDEFASTPINGAVGYTAAKCIACPQAVYSTEALHSHAQGTVILSFTIDKHGRTKDVRVKQAMPDGLTQQAIDAVLGWKFTPAKDPRGKKIDVRQTTEVEFHQ